MSPNSSRGLKMQFHFHVKEKTRTENLTDPTGGNLPSHHFAKLHSFLEGLMEQINMQKFMKGSGRSTICHVLSEFYAPHI